MKKFGNLLDFNKMQFEAIGVKAGINHTYRGYRGKQELILSISGEGLPFFLSGSTVSASRDLISFIATSYRLQ